MPKITRRTVDAIVPHERVGLATEASVPQAIFQGGPIMADNQLPVRRPLLPPASTSHY